MLGVVAITAAIRDRGLGEITPRVDGVTVPLVAAAPIPSGNCVQSVPVI